MTNQTKSSQPDDTKLAALEAELAAEKAKRQQTMADFENYRRRMDSEKAKFGALANMSVVQAILEILDDIQLARTDQELATGRAHEVLEILQAKLVAALNTAGVEQLAVAKGDKFDPAFMEAVTTIPAPGQESSTVVEVIAAAYRYRGQETLLRTAKVVVAS